MKTYALTLTLFLLACSSLRGIAQQRKSSTADSTQAKPTQTVFFELFGPGLLYSGNYDTRFNKRNDGIGGRIGISYYSDSGDNLLTVPIALNYLLGKDGKYFEVGAGITYYTLNSNFGFFNNDDNHVHDSGVFGTLNFGYRYQPSAGRFNFRAGVSPVIKSGTFVPFWPYVSFGYSFKTINLFDAIIAGLSSGFFYFYRLLKNAPMKLLSLSLLLIIIVFGSARAQHKNEFGFQTDNDSYLGQGSDRYYTDGIFLYFRHALHVKAADSTSLQNKVLGFEAGQKIFNPQSGQVPSAAYVDRPFAGYLYIGSTLNLLYRNESNLKLSAQLGIIGPGSLADKVQTDVHNWFGFYPPAGWNYQIHDGAQLNLAAEYNKLLARADGIDVSLSSYADIGNGFTGAGIGPLLRLGNFNQLFNSVSTQSTAIRSQGKAPLHEQELFFYYKPQINAVVYDATIQGSLFNKTVYPEQITGTKEPFIFSNQIGGAWASKHFVIDFNVIINTRATKEMVMATHQWGSLTVLYRFD